MSAAKAKCSFCDGDASFGPCGKAHVCEPCARRIVNLAANRWNGALPAIWSSAASASAKVKAPSAPPNELNPDEVFAEFKRGVERQISAEDADSHLNLAIAYREMSLYGDAVREAAEAFRGPLERARRQEALRMLLGAPLLMPNGLAALRARLRMN